MVYSFDIFDTLLSRDIATPRDLFQLVSLRAGSKHANVFPTTLLLDFPRLRVDAEVLAVEESTRDDVMIDEIYSTIAKCCPDMTQTMLDRLMALELELEIKHSYPIAANIARVEELLDRAERVMLLSDMYLPRETVTGMLAKASQRLAKLPLYLSSEAGLSKKTGGLFDYVCLEEGVAPEEILHTGDNLFSDFLNSRSKGMQACHYQTSELTEYEYAYCHEGNGTTASILAGASKKARLSKVEPTPCYLLGSGFTGPFFYGFADYLVEQAEARGIRRLYFLARDGFLLRDMVEIVMRQRGSHLKCAYLYLSRQSVYLAGIHHLSKSSLAWVFEGKPSLSKVAKRLDMQPDQMRQHTELRSSLANCSDDIALPQKLAEKIMDTILNEETMREQVLATAQASRERLLAYLKQEVDAKDLTNMALVDLGWQGSIQDTLYGILSNENRKFALIGFYYGCLKFNRFSNNNNQKIPYHLYPSIRPGLAPILECLTAASHGTTLDYRCNEVGTWEPVLKENECDRAEGWDFQAYRQGVLDFTANAAAMFAQYPELPPCFRGIDNNLNEALEDGIQLVAEVIGELSYDSRLDELSPKVIAPPFPPLVALKYLFSKPKQRQAMTQWFRASYLRSRPVSRFILSLDPFPYLSSFIKANFNQTDMKIRYIKLKFAIRRYLSSFFKL